jgi:hypothetical protein
LGGTIWNAEWQASEAAFDLAFVTFGLLTTAVVVRDSRALERWINPVMTGLLAGVFAVFFQLVLLFGKEPLFRSLVLAAAVLAGLGLARNPAIERWRIPLFLAVYAGLGIWRIQSAPSPHIDVWVWHHEALEALLHGHNPYAMTMPNIYPDATFYDPSMVVNGRVLTGFQYPPVSLYFALPGYLLGDYRYSLLAAMLIAGACMAYATPNGLGAIAMALWLGSPRNLFMLKHGFTEPMLVMLFAVFLFALSRRSKWAFIPLGLLLAGKQYVPMFVPALWLLPADEGQPHARLRLVLYALAFGGAVTLPFFLIDPKAFLDSVVLLQLRQPFRVESLGLVSWWFQHYGKLLPFWLSFASLVPTSALVIWRCTRSTSNVAAGLAFISFTFFAVSKQSFGNHYFFVLGVICCAVAYVDNADRRSSS